MSVRYISEKEALKSLELSILEPRDRRRIKEIKGNLFTYLALVELPWYRRILRRIFKKG